MWFAEGNLVALNEVKNNHIHKHTQGTHFTVWFAVGNLAALNIAANRNLCSALLCILQPRCSRLPVYRSQLP